jgi:AraC-like DNA-binding protein/mannose-6-phosphate isomerase-like protein (cupin superfamily)
MQGAKERIVMPSGHSFRVLRWGRSVGKVECVVSPGEVRPITGEGAHWHYHVEMELTLFTQGEGTRFVGDHIGQFGPGDLVLLGENVPHYWHARGICSGMALQWHFPASHPFWAVFRAADRGLRLKSQAAARIRDVLATVPHATGAARLAALVHVLSLIARADADERVSLSKRSFNLPAQSQYQDAIAQAVRYLISRYRDEVRLEELLDLTQMSRPTFSRQFRKHAGRTFSGFLNHLRLEAACRDLRESDHGILDIALRCGFSQVSFFNRLFRRELKCSPSEYRRTSRGSRSLPAVA